MFKLVYCSIILKPPAWVTFYSFLDHVWTEEETARAKPLWAHQCSPRSVTQPAHRGSGPRQCRCRVATVQRRAPMHGCFLSACGPPLCRSTHRSLLLGLTRLLKPCNFLGGRHICCSNEVTLGAPGWGWSPNEPSHDEKLQIFSHPTTPSSQEGRLEMELINHVYRMKSP